MLFVCCVDCLIGIAYWFGYLFGGYVALVYFEVDCLVIRRDCFVFGMDVLLCLLS